MRCAGPPGEGKTPYPTFLIENITRDDSKLHTVFVLKGTCFVGHDAIPHTSDSYWCHCRFRCLMVDVGDYTYSVSRYCGVFVVILARLVFKWIICGAALE